MGRRASRNSRRSHGKTWRTIPPTLRSLRAKGYTPRSARGYTFLPERDIPLWNEGVHPFPQTVRSLSPKVQRLAAKVRAFVRQRPLARAFHVPPRRRPWTISVRQNGATPCYCTEKPFNSFGNLFNSFWNLFNGFSNSIIVSAIKGIDGIWEGRASSRPFYMAATKRGPPNVSTPFVAESIGCFKQVVSLHPARRQARRFLVDPSQSRTTIQVNRELDLK